MCFFQASENAKMDDVIFDLVIYAIIGVLSVVALITSESRTRSNRHMFLYTSIIAFALLMFINISVPVYHYLVNDQRFRPAYTSYIIIATYIFFNIQKNVVAIILGVLATIAHVTILIIITYQQEADTEEKVDNLLQIVSMTCINCNRGKIRKKIVKFRMKVLRV